LRACAAPGLNPMVWTDAVLNLIANDMRSGAILF